MFAYRPLPELAGYRTPVGGLYLTGASTHPGGGVFGASGRTAARVLLADRATAPLARVARAAVGALRQAPR
jgi:phytoene dehydrogenase-like protein